MKLCFQGEELFVRRVTVELYEPTREKETVLTYFATWHHRTRMAV